MDANGRWAEQRGLNRSDGHSAGTENIRRVIEEFGQRGVEVLTIFAFSTENWKRPHLEVRGLMWLLPRTIDRELQPLHEAGVRPHYFGRLEVLDAGVRHQVEHAVERTRHNDRMTVCVAFNYGGLAELVDAMRKLIADGIPPESVTEELVDSYLYTAGVPDPDLIIRTGDEQRLSTFLIWQAAYAEYHFTDTYSPDFGAEDIDAALADHSCRERRLGGSSQEVETSRENVCRARHGSSEELTRLAPTDLSTRRARAADAARSTRSDGRGTRDGWCRSRARRWRSPSERGSVSRPG
jgi:undecaprenyl diphosphate synthase